MKFNKEVFNRLVKIIGSKQGVYSAVRRYEGKFKAYTSEAIFYFIAAKNNIKISKHRLSESLLTKVDELLERDKNPEGTKKKEIKVITKKIGKEDPFDFPLTKFRLHAGLTEDCSPIFKKPFRSAIKEALLNLEDHIRNKLKSDKDGKDLISEARAKSVFNRKRGSETEGLFFLYAGAIGWLRNPPNHQKLKYGKEEAIKIILFTDYLIQLFDQLCLENKIIQ